MLLEDLLNEMPRYINTQQHDWSCGPVALINALKFAGIPKTYRCEISRFMNYSDKATDGNGGLPEKEIHKYLKEHGIYAVRKRNTYIKSLDKALDAGHGAIIGYCHNVGCHYIFLERWLSRDEKLYDVKNDSAIGPGAWDREQLKKWFRNNRRRGWPPDMWIIKK